MALDQDHRASGEESNRPALWCVDSLGAYLRLRQRRPMTIRSALFVLCPGRPPTVGEFDVIADGLWLVRQELEEVVQLRDLDLEAVEAALDDHDPLRCQSSGTIS